MANRRDATSRRGVPRGRYRRPGAPAAFPTLQPLAQRLERLRLERGLTQGALARRAGISPNHYLDIAHAQANPTAIVLIKLAETLGAPVTDLFDSAPAEADEWRTVAAADLEDLAVLHERLTGIVSRLIKTELHRHRHTKTRHHR